MRKGTGRRKVLCPTMRVGGELLVCAWACVRVAGCTCACGCCGGKREVSRAGWGVLASPHSSGVGNAKITKRNGESGQKN